MQHLIKLIILALLISLVACSPPKKENFDMAMTNIEQLTRWNEFEGILNMMDPEYLKEHPVSELDIARLKQFRISGYTVRQKQMNDDGTVFIQSVILQMYNTHNPVERQVRWDQEWHLNPETKRWALFSGFPDVTQH